LFANSILLLFRDKVNWFDKICARTKPVLT